MEEDKRKQKLKAGKEKLAAFQKKKERKKKHLDDVDGTEAKSSGDTDVSSSSDVPYSDSDEIAVSGDEFSKDDGRTSLKMRKSLLTATERITELEELLQGKQLALDAVVEENTKLKASNHLASNHNVEEAIRKRDDIIQQLSARIQATDAASKANDTLATEAMVQEVQKLQRQLQEAGNLLKAQGEKHGELSKILQDTTAEVLTSRQHLSDKEAIQIQMEDKLSRLTEERDHLKSINEELKAKEDLLNRKLENQTEFVEKENVEELGSRKKVIENLCTELNESKKREQEMGEVMKKLMLHAEDVQKQGVTMTCGEMISVSEMNSKVGHVTAKLDEKYGLQIAQIKEDLLQQHHFELDQVNAELSQKHAEYQKLLVQYHESESIQKSLQLELEQFIHCDSDRTEEIQYLQSKCEELSDHVSAISASESYLKEEREQLHLTLLSLEQKLQGLEMEKVEKEKLEKELCGLSEERQFLLHKIEFSEDKLLELENRKDESEKLKSLLTDAESKLRTIETEREDELEHLKELEQLQTENKELTNKVEHCEKEILKNEEQKTQFQREKEKMALELDQMNEEFEQMAQRARQHEAQAKEIEELMAQLSISQQERQGLRMQNDELKNKINLQHDSVISQKCRLDEVMNEYSTLQEKVTHMEQENAAIKEGLTGNLEKVQFNLEKMAEENSDLNSQLEKLKAENEFTVRELRDLLDGMRQEHIKLKSELAEKEELILKEETERIDLCAVIEAKLEAKEKKCNELEIQLLKKETELLQLQSELRLQETFTPSQVQAVSQEMLSADSCNDSSTDNVNMELILEQVILQEVVPSQNSTVSMETSVDHNYSAARHLETLEPSAVESKDATEDDILMAETENMQTTKENIDTFKAQIDPLNESLYLSTEKEKNYETQLSDLQKQILVLNCEKEQLTKEVVEMSESSFVVKTEIETLHQNITDLESDRMSLLNKLDKVLIERDKLVTVLKDSGKSDVEPKFDDSLDDASDESRDVPKCSSPNDSLEEGTEEPDHGTPDVSRVVEGSAFRGNNEMVRNCMPTLEGHLFSSERSSLNVGKFGASALYTPDTGHNVVETCAHVQTEGDFNICQIEQLEVNQNIERNFNKHSNSQEVLQKVYSLRSKIQLLKENLQLNAVEPMEILRTMECVSSFCERLQKENETVTEERDMLKKDNDIFKESVCSLRDELDLVQENLEETQGQLHNSMMKYDEVKSNYERLQDHYDVMGDENHSLRLDYDELQGRYDAIVLENETLAKSVRDSEILSSKIFNESEELMHRLNELEHANTDLTNLREKHQILEQECGRLKSENFEMRESFDQIERLSEEKQKQLENIEEELCKVSAKQLDSWDQVDKLTKTNQALQEELKRKMEEIHTVSVKFHDSLKRIESVEEEKAMNIEKIKMLEKRVNEKDKIRTENENFRSQLRMLTFELNEKKNENSHLSDQKKSLQETSDQQRQKFEDKILHLASENSKLLKQIESDRDQLLQSQNLVTELRQSVEKAQEDRREMQENIDSLHIQVDEFLRMRNDLDENMKAKEQNFAQERAELEDRIESLNIQAEEFMRMRQDLEEKLNKASVDEKADDNTEDEVSVKERLTKFEEALEQKEKALTDIIERVKILEEENVELRNENAEYEEQVENLEGKLQYTTDRLSEHLEIIDELSAENESLKKKNSLLEESKKSEIEALQYSLIENMKELENLRLELGNEMENRMQEKSQNIGQLRKDIEELKSHISDTEARSEEPPVAEEIVVPLNKLQGNLLKITQEMGKVCLTDVATTETSDEEKETSGDTSQTNDVKEDDVIITESYVQETEISTTQNVMSKVENIELKKENGRLQEKIHQLELEKSELRVQVKRSIKRQNSDDKEQTEAIFEENCYFIDQVEKLNAEMSSLKHCSDESDGQTTSYSNEIEKLQNKVESLQEENERLVATLKKTENSHTTSDGIYSVENQLLKVNELEEQLAHKTRQVEQLTNKVLELTGNFQQAKSEYKYLAEKVKEETDRTKNITAELVKSMQSNVKLQEDVAAMRTEMTSVIESGATVENSLEMVKVTIIKREAQIGDLEKKLETEVILRNETADRLEEVTSQLTETCQQKEELVSQLSVFQKENNESTNQVSVFQQWNDELSSQLAESRVEKAELAHQIAETLQKKEKLLSQLSKSQQEKENALHYGKDLETQLDEKCQEANASQSRLNEVCTLNEQLKLKINELESDTTNCESLYSDKLFSDVQNQSEIDKLTEKLQNINQKCRRLELEREDLVTENEKLRSKMEEREYYIQALSKTGVVGEDGSDPGELQQLTLTICRREMEIEGLKKKIKVLEEENDSFKKLEDDFERVKSERDDLLMLHDALSEDLTGMRTKYETVRSLMDSTKKECNKEIEKLREQLSSVNIDVTGLRETLESLESEMTQTMEQKAQLVEALEEEKRRRDEFAKQQELKDISDKLNKDLRNQRKANKSLLNQSSDSASVETSSFVSATDNLRELSFMVLTFDASTQVELDPEFEQCTISQLITEYESRVSDLSGEVDSLKSEYDELKLKHESETIELQRRIDQIKRTGSLYEVENGSEGNDFVAENFVETNSEDNNGYSNEDPDAGKRTNTHSGTRFIKNHRESDTVISEEECQTDITMDTCEVVDKSEIESIIEQRCRTKLSQLEYQMEERFAFELRNKQVELMDECEKEKKEFIKEMDQTIKRKTQAVQVEKQKEFVQALQKMKKDFHKQWKGKKFKGKEDQTSEEKDSSHDKKAVGQQESVVSRLKKENQVLAEARDEMMRQIDQLQKEKQVLMGEFEEITDEEHEETTPAGFFLHHDQSGDLQSVLTPSSPFDTGDVFSEELICPREDCQLLHQKYVELQDQIQNIGFEPVGSYNQNASFEIQQAGRAQGFEPEIMDPSIESEEAFVCEAVQGAEADCVLKHPEFRFQSSRDGEIVKEMDLNKKADLNDKLDDSMEVIEHFIAETDQPQTTASHFTPENSSAEEEVFLVEGFISSEIEARTEMEVDSVETPYFLAGRSLSLPSIHAGGDASEKPSEKPSQMQMYAKHFVECIEELKSKTVSERENYFKEKSENRASRTVDFSFGTEKIVKGGVTRKRHLSQSSPPPAAANQFLRQFSYEAEDILPMSKDIGREKDNQIDLLPLESKVSCLEFQVSFLEQKITIVEKEKQNIQIHLDNEILQRQQLEEEIENLNIHVSQSDTRSGSEMKFKGDLNQSAKLQQSLQDLAAKLDESTQTCKSLEHSLILTQSKLDEERKSTEKKDREIYDLKGQVHILGVENSEKEYYNLRMEENLENIQEEIDPLLIQIKVQQKEIETLNKKVSEKQRSVVAHDQQTQTKESVDRTQTKTQKLISDDEKSFFDEFSLDTVECTHTISRDILSEHVLHKVNRELSTAEEEIQRLSMQVRNKTDKVSELESGMLNIHGTLVHKDTDVQNLCEKVQEVQKENMELKNQKFNRQSSADELEIMKLRGQIFELNEVLVERGNEIVKLENIIAQLNAEVSRLETRNLNTSSESCQYCADMDKTVKEKDAYIRKLEEHLLGQNMLPSRSVSSSREVTPTQSPRGGAIDHHQAASRRGSTPILSLRYKDDFTETRRCSIPILEHGGESSRDGEKTPTETFVPPFLSPPNKNCTYIQAKEGPKVLLPTDKVESSTDNLSHVSKESYSESKTASRKRGRPSGRFKGHGPLLPWRSPLDDFSDQSTISAFSSPRLERGDLFDSQFVPELHSSFRSRSPTCSSVSGSVDDSDRILSGLGPDQDGHVALEHKHFELIDEITQLRRDLRETKSIYTQENALLQEALDRETWMKESMRSKLGMSGTIVNFDLSAELIALRQKVAMLQETNKMLHSENDKWLRKIQEQEQLVLQLREQLGHDVGNFGEVDILFGKQVLMLQKQRNELLDKIQEKDLENNRLSKKIGDMNVIEENLRREKDFLKVKLREKEDVEAEIIQGKLEIERLSQKQEKLEEVLYHKDIMEKELMKQKRLLEMDLSEIEAKLEEKEEMLELQKNQLLQELKGGGSPSAESVRESENGGSSTQVVPHSGISDHDEVCRLHSMLEDAQVQHSKAIESLKHKYKAEYRQREGALRELGHREQLTSVNSEHDHKV